MGLVVSKYIFNIFCFISLELTKLHLSSVSRIIHMYLVLFTSYYETFKIIVRKVNKIGIRMLPRFLDTP